MPSMLLLAVALASVASVATAISVDTYATGADYPFVVHNPSSKPKAAMIFLHGSGSCGSDLSSNPFWDGLGYMMQQSGDAAQIAQNDLVAVLPLHPDCNSAVREWDPAKVQSVVDLVNSKYDIPEWYGGGYSMGGKGLWVFAMSNPTLLKKMVVSAGYTEFSSTLNVLSASDVSPLKDIPMWLFAGAEDTKQPASSTAGPLVSLLKSIGAPSVQYTTLATDHSGMSHIPWDNVALWQWVTNSSSSSSSGSSGTKATSASTASSTGTAAGVKAKAVQSSASSSSTSKASNPKCKADSSGSRRRRQRRALLAAQASERIERRHRERRALTPRHPGQPRKFDYGGPHGAPSTS